MREKRGGFAKGWADKMTIQGQLGSSGADGWSLRWVSHNIKTPSQRPLLVPRTGALGGRVPSTIVPSVACQTTEGEYLPTNHIYLLIPCSYPTGTY